jgi:hypothetical protein
MARIPRTAGTGESDHDKPGRWHGALVMALGCAFVSGSSCGVSMVDFAAHMDGPGIGLEWSRPLGSEYGLREGMVLATLVVHGLLSLMFYGHTGAKPIGVLALPGVWFVAFLVGLVGGGRGLAPWWKLGSDRGHGYACYAASGVTRGTESAALEERGCAGDVGIACERIVRRDPSRLPGLCADRARACLEEPPGTREVFGRCYGMAEVCRILEPSSGPPSTRD